MEKLINKFWNGEVTLWKSYWLVGELINVLFILVIFNFEIYFFNNQLFSSLPFINFNNFNFLSKLVVIAWTIFITVGIWRSAEKYKGSLFWVICTLLFLSYRVFALRLIFFS
jgi:hypothetical protein